MSPALPCLSHTLPVVLRAGLRCQYNQVQSSKGTHQPRDVDLQGEGWGGYCFCYVCWQRTVTRPLDTNRVVFKVPGQRGLDPGDAATVDSITFAFSRSSYHMQWDKFLLAPTGSHIPLSCFQQIRKPVVSLFWLSNCTREFKRH